MPFRSTQFHSQSYDIFYCLKYRLEYILLLLFCVWILKVYLVFLDTFAAHNAILNSERFGKGNLLTTKGALINRNDYF